MRPSGMYIVARERAGELTSMRAERAVRWLKGLRGKISQSVDGASCLRRRTTCGEGGGQASMYAASVCGERRRLRGGTARARGECYVTLDGRPAAAGMRAGAAAGAGVASGAVERVGASEASRGEAEPLRKRVTAQRGNERRGTSRFVGCGMGERGGEARPHHGGVRAPGGFVRGAWLLIPDVQELSRVT